VYRHLGDRTDQAPCLTRVTNVGVPWTTACPAGSVQPRSELAQRVGVQVGDIHLSSFAALGTGY